MSGEQDFEALERVGERAWQLHDQPDAGLWEFRTLKAVHTYSSAMCWAACDRLANAAARSGSTQKQALWAERASHIRDYIEKRRVEAGCADHVRHPRPARSSTRA